MKVRPERLAYTNFFPECEAAEEARYEANAAAEAAAMAEAEDEAERQAQESEHVHTSLSERI